jgi:hypothetical protein
VALSSPLGTGCSWSKYSQLGAADL